ncbi:methyltransferase [Nocardiopsis potens]|uniref:methyltransferase n=1 Tax=Nocardiopsis potens TaxID=1246458 RepID=UPI00034AD78E|nr:methyltransferase [Nocardiopsis potens]
MNADADKVGAGLVAVLNAVSAGTAAQVFAAAIEIDVFGAAAGEPVGAERIRERLGLHPRAVPDFLDALAAMGLMVREDGGYRSTAAAERHLSAASDEFIGHFVAGADAGDLVRLLRTGMPPERPEEEGGDPYADPAVARSFIAFMDSMNAMIDDDLLAAVDWSRYTSFTDVDGSRGGLAAALVAAHPHLTGTVVDRPEVEAAFEERFAGDPARSRVSFRASGDGPLPEAEVVLVGGVLHDISMSERKELLRRVYDAVAPGGVALVYDIMLDDERTRLDPLLGSLQMMMTVPDGGKYTAGECRAWVEAAGFARTEVRPMGVDTLIEARKA